MTPDFIVIGAMKCGTTTLAAQLGAQNGIFVSEPKEPNYFSDDKIYARGTEWYQSLFLPADPNDLKGEASTHYTKRPDLPETVNRMSKMVPETKLIYMIRDPMVRLVSHYIHDWSQGVLSGPLEAALDSHKPLIDYGRYGWQIAPFIEAFGSDAVILTSLERFKMNFGEELSRVATHIGYQQPTTWSEEVAKQNVSAERSRKLPFQKLLIENRVAKTLRQTLVPKSVRTRIRQSRRMKERPEISPGRIASLHAIFQEDRAILAKSFPNDPTLELSYPFAS